LTSKGKKVALEYRRELERLIEEWQPFLWTEPLHFRCSVRDFTKLFCERSGQK
jgi:hypothetical protein